MYHVVIVHYPECGLEDDAVIFRTAAGREELEHALCRAKFLAPAELDRINRTDWILKVAHELVGGSYVFVEKAATMEVEG